MERRRPRGASGLLKRGNSLPRVIEEAVLLERDPELARLGELMADAKSGHGRIALVAGAAGIGKTSLLAGAAARAQEDGLRVLSGRGRQLEQELAWGVARQLFGPVIARLSREGVALGGAAELAAPALGVGGASPSRAADASGTLHGLYWLISDLAAAGPLLLTVDDAHWADAQSQRHLAHLAARVADLPVALVITLRRGLETPMLASIAAEPPAAVIELHELTAAASTMLIDATMDGVAESSFCEACHASTGGNPFFLRELLDRVRADGLIPTAANAVAVSDITPQTVTHSVLLRVSALPPHARRLATAVAVLGGGVGIAPAGRLAELAPGEAAAAADALARADILQTRSPLEFVHPIVRAAVYEDLTQFERGQAHVRAAQVLVDLGADPERVAAQLLRTEPGGDRWVVEQLRRAADSAFARAAPDAATVFLGRGAEEFPGEPDSSLLLARGHAAAMAQLPDAVEHLRAAFTAARDATERSAVALELAPLLSLAGRFAEAIELCDGALAGISADDREQRLLLTAALIGAASLDDSLIGVAREWAAQLDDEIPGDTPAERLALVSQIAIGNISGVSVRRMGELATRALGDGALLRDVTSDNPFYTWTTTSIMFADLFDAARTAMEAALADATARGSTLGFALSNAYRACLNYRTGRLADAVADARLSLGSGALDVVPVTMSHVTAFLVETLIELDQLDEAEQRLGAYAGTEVEAFRTGMLRSSAGRVALARGEPAAAAELLLSAGELIANTAPAVWPWRASAALALHALERTDEATELVEREIEICERVESRWALAIALDAHGRIVGGEQGISSLSRAVESARECGATLEQARALFGLGAAQRRAGHRRLATDTLLAAYDLADLCGAVRIRDAARAELRVAGARPRRERLERHTSLTPSELRVAEMAAGGASNKDVAQALFVSLRTVETHLTHVYQKLGISSRGELARALEQ